MALLSLTLSRYFMNFDQNLRDREIDVLWYGGVNDCYKNDLKFDTLALYLDAIYHEVNDWQSAH